MARLPVNFNASSNFDAKLKEFMDAETDNSLEHVAKQQKKWRGSKSKHQASAKTSKEHHDLKHGATACFNSGSVVLAL